MNPSSICTINTNIVSTQRRQYRILTTAGGGSVPLSLERAQLLNDIGFEWSAKDPSHKTWEGRYAELREFVVRLVWESDYISVLDFVVLQNE